MVFFGNRIPNSELRTPNSETLTRVENLLYVKIFELEQSLPTKKISRKGRKGSHYILSFDFGARSSEIGNRFEQKIFALLKFPQLSSA